MAPLFKLTLPLSVLGLLAGCADLNQATGPTRVTTTQSALTATVPGDYATIQAAVDAAGVGDVVQVAAGTFTENITLKTGVTLAGAGVDATTIYGTITLSGCADVTISDLTLRGDLSPGATGIDAHDAMFALARATVRDFSVCARITGASAAAMDRSQLQRGHTEGLLVEGAAHVTLTNSVISTAQQHGLHVAAGATGSVTVTNSLLWGNGWPSQGAALLTEAGGVHLSNSIVTANRRGLDCAGACSNDHNIIWGNFTDYVGTAAPGAGNLAVDPQLTNLNEGEFTLTAGSPAIDAGTSSGAPDHDYFGATRPAGAGIDIGPHEYPQDTVPVVVITEVMANPLNEGAGEFVELMNTSTVDVDMQGWVIDDGDSTDALVGWQGGSTVIPGGGFAVIVDPDYATNPTYTIAPGAVVLSVSSSKTLGSGLSTGDPVTLWQGLMPIDTFGFPFDPGNGVSAEKGAIEDGDVAGNWVASPCGSSPGSDNCAWAAPPSPTEAGIRITEIMANPLAESSGEYIELYNDGDQALDLEGWVIDDGDSADTIAGWQGGTTVVASSGYAVILDPDYADQYVIDADAVLLTVASSATLGNALSTNDPITLRGPDDAVIDSYSTPFDPGNGVSVERESPEAPDIASSWSASSCPAGGSPGSANCAATPPTSGPATVAITEVMANALDEDTGEFVELYNFGTEPVDLHDWRIDDGDTSEPLGPYVAGATMLLQPGAFALIMDSEYVEGTYAIEANVLRLRTPDSSIASGLATTDPITVLAPDGAVVSSWSSPFNPGNGTSAQIVDLLVGDVPSNWVFTTCGASPGAIDCAGGPVTVDIALTPLGVVISEVMGNPLDEGTGEFVELYNAGTLPVDLTTLNISDSSTTEAIVAFGAGPTTLQPGAYGLIVDSDYAGEYALSGDALLVTTADKTIGTGLAATEPVSLSNAAGDVLSTYGHPLNPGNGTSTERVTPTSSDAPDAWVKSSCASGSSPGAANCVSPGAPASGTLADGDGCPFGSGECSGGVCLTDALTDLSLCASDCATAACPAAFVCAATGDAVWSQVCWPQGDGPVDPTPGAVPPLLLTEVAVSPGAAEFVEIHNPNGVAVALDHVYLADYSGYEGITTGTASPNSADFRMRFPPGSSIAPGAYVTVGLESASHFEAEHGLYPSYDTWPSDGNAPSMVGQIGSSAGLGNGSEMVVLFYWDGTTPLLSDLDYVVYGSSSMGMDKTGVTVGIHSYGPETALELQTEAPTPGTGASLERCDLAETGQVATGGNGGDGEDHTSEPFPNTWQVVTAASPGAAGQACAAPCVPSCVGDCGSDGCGGSCGSCAGGEVCEAGSCQPVATGLALTTINKGFGGWSLPEGLGMTHTLERFTTAAEFEGYFGVSPPTEANFATADIVFFSAGAHPVGAGNDAVITEIVDNTVELFVFTTRTYPEEDCITLNLPVPVWNMYSVSKPPSGAATLTEIFGEDGLWCLDPEAAPLGGACGPTQVCGEDLVCAGVTYGVGEGNCNPKWMWGTFYAQTPVAIPDAGSVTLPLVVSTLASVEVDVILYVDIAHPDPSQLTLTMLNPVNEFGEVSQSVTVFDQAPISGSSLVIHTAITGFSGDEVANGEWALVVEDHATGSTGVVTALWTEMTSRWD